MKNPTVILFIIIFVWLFLIKDKLGIVEKIVTNLTSSDSTNEEIVKLDTEKKLSKNVEDSSSNQNFESRMDQIIKSIEDIKKQESHNNQKIEFDWLQFKSDETGLVSYIDQKNIKLQNNKVHYFQMMNNIPQIENIQKGLCPNTNVHIKSTLLYFDFDCGSKIINMNEHKGFSGNMVTGKKVCDLGLGKQRVFSPYNELDSFIFKYCKK